jgi:DNA (cytosine-5)-methyltransferase 1
MGNKNSSDPRNYLFENYVRIVETIQPKCFLFENVKGLFTMFEGRFFVKVVKAFLEIGYNI